MRSPVLLAEVVEVGSSIDNRVTCLLSMGVGRLHVKCM